MVYKAFAETFLLKTTQRKSALDSEKNVQQLRDEKLHALSLL